MCKPHYVEALIVLHMTVTGKRIKYTQKGLAEYLHMTEDQLIKILKHGKSNVINMIALIKKVRVTSTISLSCEHDIYVECLRDYMEKNKATNKKPLLDQSDLLHITRVAIVALIHGITKEVDIYNKLDVCQSTYNSKYRETFNHVLYFVYKEIRGVVNRIYERLDKFQRD